MATPYEIKKALEEVAYEHKKLGKNMGLAIYLASKRTGVSTKIISDELRQRKKKHNATPTTPPDDYLSAWQKAKEN